MKEGRELEERNKKGGKEREVIIYMPHTGSSIIPESHSPLAMSLCSSDSKEKELGTNTSLLTTLKFSYIAALSIHAIACCWFAISCKNQAVFDEDSSESLCKTDSWVAGLEGEESSYLME